ncbi:MAG: glutaredoxin family protein [Verrucomicrobia bacterium]|nr:glutaredoxin family protein [Verrucomicrobiota bacterium]
MINSMKLYIKGGCPWCVMAETWLDQRGVDYEAIDVLSDATAFAEMKKISGQSKAPVLVTAEGRILSDFGPEELPGFLEI